MWITNLIWPLLFSLSVNFTQIGHATTFYPIERHNNGKFACGGGDWEDADQPICAHRTLPCGSWIKLRNLSNGVNTWCRVMDRGPYGKIDENGEWFNGALDRAREGRWKGVLDMGPQVAARLGSKGRIKVKISYRKNSFWACTLDNMFPVLKNKFRRSNCKVNQWIDG